jgi:hypothetical protein
MSKKYSSNDKDRLLCERFRTFVQSEGREWDTSLQTYVPTGDDRDPWRASAKERDRNFGVEREYDHDEDEAPVQVSTDEERKINGAIDVFLKKMNSNSEGWWPQTWVGGGTRVWAGSGYRELEPEEIKDRAAKISARIKQLRKDSKRLPFTRKHIAIDLASNEHSAFTEDEEHGLVPSVFLFVQDHLVKPIAADLGRSKTDVQKMIELLTAADAAADADEGESQ